MEAEAGKVDEKKKVLVAIEESECSRYALQWALENLDHSIKNSKLIVFSVVPIDDLGYTYASSFGTAPPELFRSIQENQKKVKLAVLERAKEICAQHGVVAETLIETGNPKETICEAVEKLNVQLVVLGSHSRGAIQRAFLGSVSNYCVHNAKCPVLVVKKPH
ncbi:hypothetical protein L6164_026855 [Bauhinia variegata]|uniref:Uncharacterized protein n=1 Tax=Bauhinia variegata TaxID=167791 RepID=A0ACB9LSB8_BAUVA|nr:hypothetical protein L6164_026855 [Bauhinia variegata]